MLILVLLCSSGRTLAQQSKKLIADGNQLYQKGKYKEASLKYSQALKADTSAADAGIFNLGNALYQQKQMDAARQAYAASGKKAGNNAEKARADYNTGNTFMKERKWEDAVEAYKNALRKNPQDADAKYNLSYAQQMLKHDNKGGGGKDKNKDKDKDQDKKDQQNKDQDKNKDQQNKDQQNKDQQDQKDKQDKKDQQGQPKDQDNKDQQDRQHPQPQPSKLSQQQADQLLNALQQEEKKLQDKNKKVQGTPVRMEKDW